MDLLVGIGNPAGQLLDLKLDRSGTRTAGERRRPTALRTVEIDGAAVDARRGAGLEAIDLKPQSSQAPLIPCGGPFAGAAAGRLGFARMHQGLQEGAGRQNHGDVLDTRRRRGRGPDDPADVGRASASTSRSSTTSCRRCRFVLLLDDPFDFLLVAFLIGLGAGPVHGGPLAAIEQAKLEPGRVDRASHGSAQRIDFPDDLPFSHATNGRIAAHLTDRVEADA